MPRQPTPRSVQLAWLRKWLRPAVIPAFLPLVLAACAAPPNVISGAHPADPSAKTPALAYATVTGGVKAFRPVEPKGWEELNRQVTPNGN
jgi:hypothetical protein